MNTANFKLDQLVLINLNSMTLTLITNSIRFVSNPVYVCVILSSLNSFQLA